MPRTSTWSIDPGIGAENVAASGPQGAGALREDVEVAGEDDQRLFGARLHPRKHEAQLGVGLGLVMRAVQVRDDHAAASGRLELDALRHPPLAGRVEHRRGDRDDPQVVRDENRVPLTCERRPDQTVVRGGQRAPDGRGHRQGADRRPLCHHRHLGHFGPAAESSQRPSRNLLEADDIRPVGGDELDHLAEVGAPSRRDRVAVEEVPGPDEHGVVTPVSAVQLWPRENRAGQGRRERE